MFALKMKVDTALTPKRLLELQKMGRMVFRAAHIGNQRWQNILLAAAGFKFHLYERTMMGRDETYDAGAYVRREAREEMVAATDILVPYARFSSKPLGCSDGTPAQFHLRTFQRLFPEQIGLQAQFLLRHKEKLQKAIALLIDHGPTESKLINRYAFACGCTAFLEERSGEFQARCAHDAVSLPKKAAAASVIDFFEAVASLLGSDSIVACSGGAVPSLHVGVFLMHLAGWWEGGCPESYELSGRSLVKFAPTAHFSSDVRTLGDIILHDGGKDKLAPQQLTIALIPSAEFQFGYLEGHEPSTRFFQICQEILATQRRKRESLRLAAEQDKPSVEILNARLAELVHDLESLSPEWDFGSHSRSGTFFSHHDLLEYGGRLIVPEDFLELPFATLRTLHERLVQIREFHKKAG